METERLSFVAGDFEDTVKRVKRIPWIPKLLKGMYLRIRGLLRLYGSVGLILLVFGSKDSYRLEAGVLAYVDGDALGSPYASAFQKAASDESTMIAVAAAMVAQINVVALTLSWPSQTHWVARALLVFGLVSALMAVFYASAQQRRIGRLFEPRDIRIWIRGPPELKGDPQPFDHLQPFPTTEKLEALMQRSFTPSVAAVITMSAPQALLSASVFTLLIALGIYLGFTWTRNLDVDAGVHDSRNVFIVYIVGLAVCVGVYWIASVIQEEVFFNEYLVVKDQCKAWVHRDQDRLRKAGALRKGAEVRERERGSGEISLRE